MFLDFCCFIIFLRALVISDIAISPFSSLVSLSDSLLGIFVFLKYSFRFILDSGSSLLPYFFSKSVRFF